MASVLLFSSSVFAAAADNLPLAPDFTLEDVQGNKVNLAGYRGNQPAVLFFWTTWCPFCRDALKALNARYDELTKAGWKVIPIDIGESALKVNSFLKYNQLNFNVLLDTGLATARSYGVVGVPTYVIINKDGVIAFRDNFLPEDFNG